MLQRLPFPVIYALEALVVVPLLGGLVVVESFLAAQPFASLDLRGKHLPTNWEAAVPNHGTFLRGYLINKHPIAFAASVAVIVLSAVALFQIHRAQTAQSAAAQGQMVRRHAFARFCVFAFWGLCGYLLVIRLLVGISPA